MPNTFSQIHIQFVFAVKNRQSLIKEEFRNELEKVMCSIIVKMNCKPLAIYCNPDHVHVLIGIHTTVSCSKMMETLKSGSALWINNEKNQNKNLLGKMVMEHFPIPNHNLMQ